MPRTRKNGSEKPGIPIIYIYITDSNLLLVFFFKKKKMTNNSHYKTFIKTKKQKI